MNYNYYVWVEIEANKQRILHADIFENMLKKCANAGIGSIILSVKDTTGFGLYQSSVVPHYSNYDSDFESVDYLQKYLELAHQYSIKLYAGIDVFAEGSTKHFHPMSPGFAHPSWQTQIYGLDTDGNSMIQSVANLHSIVTTGSIDDFREVFVNPVMEEVQNYELSIVKELIEKYDIDGVVLDRARFVGLSSDFSDYTREKFENFIGKKVAVWPEDIYRLIHDEKDVEIEYGCMFGDWITFRANVIQQFITKVKETILQAEKRVEFIDYTGSWYPLYYMVGANWASSNYVPDEYPWVNAENYAKTGYAEYLDKLLSGFYYSDVTMEEAKEHKQPEYWYSVEGSAVLADKVVGNAVPYIGSLFLQQYENHADTFRRAVEMCMEKSSGCMLFDLCYIDDYDWWNLCKV